MMRVLGLLIPSSLSRGKISWDGSSWRRLQMCGQLLWTTERNAWSRTMLAVQPIAASWGLQNNFCVDAMFEKQWLLVPENSLHCSCSQLTLQSLPWALIIWSPPNSLDAEMGKIWSTEAEHTQGYQSILPRRYFSIHFKSMFPVHYNDCRLVSEVWINISFPFRHSKKSLFFKLNNWKSDFTPHIFSKANDCHRKSEIDCFSFFFKPKCFWKGISLDASLSEWSFTFHSLWAPEMKWAHRNSWVH